MPKLGIPPLPPPTTWGKTFGFKAYKYSPPCEREYQGRRSVTNPRLTDEFVKAMGVRKDEVVFELWPGIGQLTRSFFQTTRARTGEENMKEAWREERRSSTRSEGLEPKFPQWLGPSSSKGATVEPMEEKKTKGKASREGEDTPHPDPAPDAKLVVAVEPYRSSLAAGFGMKLESKDGEHLQPYFTAWQSGTHLESRDWSVKQTPYEDRLVTTYNDPYSWELMPYLLRHPLIESRLPVFNPDAPEGERAHRSFKDPLPPITLVMTIPGNVTGDQLASQFIMSVLGAAAGRPNWIWKYGRIRIAMLVHKALYDKLTALPGETAASKLSLMTRANYEVTPLPPLHHISFPAKDSESAIERTGVPTSKETPTEATLERTITTMDDFFPISGLNNSLLDPEKKTTKQLTRPLLLGLMLTPKVETMMKIEEKEEWEYVLRHMFVLRGQPVEAAIHTLGFNAGTLLKDIASESDEYAGKPVNIKWRVRYLDVEHWARIVDVFVNWPFKPENLHMDANFGQGKTFNPFEAGVGG